MTPATLEVINNLAPLGGAWILAILFVWKLDRILKEIRLMIRPAAQRVRAKKASKETGDGGLWS